MVFCKKGLIVMIALSFLFAFNTYGANGSTEFAGESMAIGVGARPLGMGGTFAAIADDASTSYWNPAGMVNIKGVEVSSVKLTKANELDTAYSYVNLVYNMGEPGAVGVGWLRQAIKGITLTNPSGGIVKELTENADNAIYLAYAYPITKGFSLGTTVKVLLGNYPAVVYTGGPAGQAADVSYTGFGADIGMYLNSEVFIKDFNYVSLGLNIQDIYTAITWDPIGNFDGGVEKVDVNFKPGIAVTVPVQPIEVILGLDLDTKYQLIVHAGGEIWWNKMVGIRGGIKNWGAINYDDVTGSLVSVGQEMDWSAGASIRWYFIGIDYAFVHNELTNVQYLSIIGRF